MATGRLAEKSCAVTGGARGGARGIGRGIAMRLAAEGAQVAVADLDFDGAQQVVGEIKAAGGDALACRCDVSDRASVRAAIKAIVDAHGSLDVIFNNAGVAEVRPFMEVKEEHWNWVMKINGLGVLICMQEAARQMIAQGRGGKIINMSSIAGRQGNTIQPHYCASKFSVVALTQAGARAFAEYGITANAICPGIVETDLWDGMDDGFIEFGIAERRGEAMERFAGGIPLGRTSTPDDLAGPAAFLASGDADYITGQCLVVDGGIVMQ